MTIQQERQALEDLEGFAERNPEEFQVIIEKLVKDRFMISLDITSFDISVAEHWSTGCSDFMKKCINKGGYEGFDILAYAKYYGGSVNEGKYSESSDEVYILHDKNMWSSDEVESQKKAVDFLDSAFDRWLKDNPNDQYTFSG